MPAADDNDDLLISGSPQFATTHWSVVLHAGTDSSPDARSALEQLCRTYWYPLYAFIRRSGHDAEAAKDLTQAFFARFLEKNYLGDVQRERGRFRSFLLASVKHFLANDWDRQRAARRGGGAPTISLDEALIEANQSQDAALALTPAQIFERRWALALLESVRLRLRVEFEGAGKPALFDALQEYLSGERGDTPYAATAERLGLSVDAIKKAVQRLRRRYGEILREEIAATVSRPAEIDEEIRHLRVVLQR